jgi:hypothetical protein
MAALETKVKIRPLSGIFATPSRWWPDFAANVEIPGGTVSYVMSRTHSSIENS